MEDTIFTNGPGAMIKLDRLLSIDFWIEAASLFSIPGFGFLLAAFITGEPIYETISLIFFAPLGIGAAFLAVVVIPFVIYIRWREKSSGEDDV